MRQEGRALCVWPQLARVRGAGTSLREAADHAEVQRKAALVAGEEHTYAIALNAPERGGTRHLALPAVHELVALLKAVAAAGPRIEYLISHLVAARQRLPCTRRRKGWCGRGGGRVGV